MQWGASISIYFTHFYLLAQNGKQNMNDGSLIAEIYANIALAPVY